jgi:hypothetical protein
MLDDMYRDPNLAPQKLSVTLKPMLPSGGRVDLLNLRVYKQGEEAPRTNRTAPPTGDTPLEVEMSLKELADPGEHAFFLEYDCRYTDGGFSLPQRERIELSRNDLLLTLVNETEGAKYTVEETTAGKTPKREEDLSRADAKKLVEKLQKQGATWRVSVRAAAAPPPAPTPTPPSA